MTDQFSKCALGEAVFTVSQKTVKAETVVTKGDIVAWSTHTTGAIASVARAASGSLIVAGVALKDIAAGAYGPILNIGIVKVKSGGCTLGKHVMAYALETDAADVRAIDADAYNKVIGRAIQTIASGDTGLIFINV